MFKKLAETQIHLWIVFIIFVGLVIGGAFWNHYYPSTGSVTITTPSGEKQVLAYGATPKLSQPDFYQSVRSQMIGEHLSFIEANLSTMLISVYQDGNVVKQVPILTKGKKGSWWETPAGLYKVEDKIKKHESSFSPVYTDWNIHFQGNFFIHGWPYWADSGEPVSSTYSGGCIRLSTDDAKTIYDLATVGEPVLVYEESSSTPYTYMPNIPQITASSYVAADLGTNFVFLNQNASSSAPSPLTSHLLTALVSTEYMDIERSVAMSGKTYNVYDLLFPLLLQGREDAASALRAELGPNYSVNLMNEKAKAIGMTETMLTRDGNDAHATTSAEDLFYLAKYLNSYRRFILDLSRGAVTNKAYGPSAFDNLKSKNSLQDIPHFVGGASQDDAALGVFDLPFSGEVRSIAIIVMGSTNVAGDVQSILDYIDRSYR